MRPADGGDLAGPAKYEIIDQLSTVQVNPNNTTTDIEQITFRSLKYDVQATFNVLASVYRADGGPPLVALRCSQLDQLVAADHVQGARGEQDQDPATGRLYNYLVLVVGTDDFSRTSEIKVRMDQIGLPSAFAAVEAAWNLIEGLGPSGAGAV